MGQYLPVIVLAVLALAFGIGSRMASQLLAPRKPSPTKLAPYECGIEDQEETSERFSVRFFLIAMIFIVFDIEIIFFYPFAGVFRELGGYGIAAILIFSFAVFESFVYLIGNGALDWGPRKIVRRAQSPMVDENRTTTSTVKRVGLEGRDPATFPAFVPTPAVAESPAHVSHDDDADADADSDVDSEEVHA